jgi:ribonucleoside-triphosphate reductase
MQPVSRRVRTIYSVIASSNRLEILRILNTKGPLSYSELKTLAGFKSKKESGKFAYHLRKLVRQMLISLNRQERKYNVTSLGRLVLNITRQVEEQSVVESGKLYVRTSKQTMEEFNSDKILQSLVREAGMPVELAQRITSETEARLYKFQAIYLTSPLIREMVNALLVEHGLEEYRHKLTRLGLPIYDISELINNTGKGEGDVETVMAKTANSVFSEYLMLSQLPRDVADAHLTGDIHLSNSGNWGLMPDTLFFDLKALQNNGINIKGKLETIPKINPPKKLEDAINLLVIFSSLLSREVSTEISFENFTSFLADFSEEKTKEELRESILRGLRLIPSKMEVGYRAPKLSLQVASNLSNSEYDAALISRVLEATLAAYEEYVKNVSIPSISIVLTVNPNLDQKFKNIISSIIYLGGKIAISTKPEIVKSFSGIQRDSGNRFPADGVEVLHSLAINLPRLSYESNRDETYFRAKLAMTIQISINALQTRKKIINNISDKSLLPVLIGDPPIVSSEYVPLIVNLVGINEAIGRLLGERTSLLERLNLTEKILETANKSVVEIGKKMGEKALISVVDSDAGIRFASMDLEKYGRAVLSGSTNSDHYHHTPVITESDLSKPDFLKSLNKSHEYSRGGFSFEIEVPSDGSIQDLSDIIGQAQKTLSFFRFLYRMEICRQCGEKFAFGKKRCDSCQSTLMKPYSAI